MRVVHVKKENCTVRIHRPYPLGNPFVVGQDGDRATVIEKFRVWAKVSPDILQLIYDLPEDSVLGCFCEPLPCHGDVIIDFWKNMHTFPDCYLNRIRSNGWCNHQQEKR